jgi:hypothetical protein
MPSLAIDLRASHALRTYRRLSERAEHGSSGCGCVVDVVVETAGQRHRNDLR